MSEGELEAEKAKSGRDEKGRFGEGWKGGPGRGKKAKVEQKGKVSATLAAMRRVASQDPEKDKGHLERHCRYLLNEDRKGFITELIKLEGKEADKRPRGKVAGPEEAQPIPELKPSPVDPSTPELKPDAGSERVEALIERLLREAAG